MASAYKGGQLKKRPLLGTALAVDPKRERERASFRRLHKEAKTVAGGGREAMASRLGGKLSRYAKTQNLADLQEKYGTLQAQAGALRDPEKEAAMAKSITAAKADVGAYAGADVGTVSMDLYKRFMKSGSPELKKYRAQKSNVAKHKILGDYYKGLLGSAETAKADYEAGIAENLGVLQAKGAPIKEQYGRRSRRLAERISDYNRFLGV